MCTQYSLLSKRRLSMYSSFEKIHRPEDQNESDRGTTLFSPQQVPVPGTRRIYTEYRKGTRHTEQGRWQSFTPIKMASSGTCEEDEGKFCGQKQEFQPVSTVGKQRLILLDQPLKQSELMNKIRKINFKNNDLSKYFYYNYIIILRY